MITVPSIESPKFADPALNRILNAVKENLDTLYGRNRTGNALFPEIATYQSDISGIMAVLDNVYEQPAADTPHQPLNLNAVGAFNSNMISWSAPSYTGHAITNIYRSASNDVGTKVLISSAPGTMYTDPVGSGSAYYYWISFSNINGVEGPLSDVAYGVTAYSFNQVMSTLIVEWEASKNYAMTDYIAPDYTPAISSSRFWFEVTTDGGSSGASAPNWASITAAGQTISDGGLVWTSRTPAQVTSPFIIGTVGGQKTVVMSSANIADASITNAKIASLAVDNAKIADLNVSKLLGGTIGAQQIYLGNTSFLLDGSTKRLTISDGAYNRVELGDLGGSAYGLILRDSSGNIFLNSGGVQLLNGVSASTVTTNAANGASAWGKFSGSGNTLPSGNVEFNYAGAASKGGNAINTDSVGAQTASAVATATVNFNSRNDRNSASVTAPTIASDGTAVDHTINADASADISFEWSWGGTNSDIDGFIIYIRQASSSAAYTFGTTPAEEQVYYVPAEKRAFILYGVTASKYYHFGVRAYRIVDPDIDSSGVKVSSIVKPSLAAENPYQPSTSVSFTGDIAGTINGGAISSYLNANVSIGSNGALSGAGGGQVTIGGLGYTGDLAATKNTVSSGTAAPSGGSNGDLYFRTTTSAWYSRIAGVWTQVSDVTAANTAAAIAGQGAFATLNQITSANVSTYIGSAAIGSAYIADLVASKITAGTISAAVEMTAATITGGTIRTNSGTGLRTVISGSDNKIHFYNASNQEVITMGTTTNGSEAYELWIRNSGNYGCLIQAANIALWGESTSGGGNAIRGRIYTGSNGTAVNGYTESSGVGNTGIMGQAWNTGNYAGAFVNYYSGAYAYMCYNDYALNLFYSGGSNIRKGSLRLEPTVAPGGTAEAGGFYVDSTTNSLLIGKTGGGWGHIPDSRSSFSSGSWTINYGASYTPTTPGFYNIISADGVVLSIYASSAWRGESGNSNIAGLIWFDGTNMKISNPNITGSTPVYYQRMT